jgi:hypothetical protein
VVGRDYPSPNGEGLEYVRRKWKEALRDPENCRLLFVVGGGGGTSSSSKEEEEEDDQAARRENEHIVRKAVGRGRYVSVTAARRCASIGDSVFPAMPPLLSGYWAVGRTLGRGGLSRF